MSEQKDTDIENTYKYDAGINIMLKFGNKYKQKLKSLITIIIPSYKRHHLLARTLEYYKNFGIKILVGDSSVNSLPNFQKYHCEYHHLPLMSFVEKIIYLTNKVDTPYILFCADDDITLENSIVECLEFLEREPTYTCAQGETLIYKELNNDILCTISFFWMFDKYTYDLKDAIQRIREGYQQNLSCFYAVRRTNTVKKIIRLTDEYAIKHTMVFEFLNYFIEYLTGNIKILPILHQIRSDEPRQDDIPLDFGTGMFSEDGENFKKIMFNELTQFYGEKKIITDEVISDIMKDILQWPYPFNKEKVIALKNKETLEFSRIPFRSLSKMGLSLNRRARREWLDFKKFIKNLEPAN